MMALRRERAVQMEGESLALTEDSMVGGTMRHGEELDAVQSPLWEAAVAHTRARSPGSFDQWFSGIQFDGVTDGVLSLRARDEFVREWVDDHFLPTIADHIRAAT